MTEQEQKLFEELKKQVKENTEKLQKIPAIGSFHTFEEYIVTVIIKDYIQNGRLRHLIRNDR